MSPESAVVRTRRVIRGGTATAAPSRSFPLIEAAPARPVAAVDGTSTPSARATTPAVDPAELERLRLEASALGYEDGLGAGRDDGRREVLAASASLLERLEHAVASYESRRQQSFDELGNDVATFAFATIEAMLGRELALSDSPVRDAIRQALRLAPERVPATVLVHPDDLDAVNAGGDTTGAREITVVADDSVEPGGCIVRANECEVDVQMSAALERLRTVLNGEVHE